jgi:hypothetical protein
MRLWRIASVAALGLAAAALFLPRAVPPVPAQLSPMGLFTSLPIWWGEADDMAARVTSPQDPHWVRTVLEEKRRVVLLDTLVAPTGFADLMMAQPRPLEPQENIALDTWVRGGGHVLLFADPMLTLESRFALGDRRRPQDTVLLSPILAHWGLSLQFDPAQLPETRENAGTGLPVHYPGTLAVQPGGDATCRIEQAGLIAECRIGKGRALIVADAALLEPAEQTAGQARTLRALMDRAFKR